jgi:hypothetical protein
MNDCKRIRGLIDESEKPGVLSYEAEGHISDCADCKAFADERASLRTLLASAPRISIPTNYDVILRARLDESRKAKDFSWFSPAGFMQLGAATAGIIIAIAATQYMGIFSGNEQPANALTNGGIAKSLPPAPVNPSLPSSQQEIDPPDVPRALAPVAIKPVKRVRSTPVYSSAKDTEGTEVDPGFVLLMGQDGQTRVSVPTVGVGAQPLLMSSAPVPVSTVRTSF